MHSTRVNSLSIPDNPVRSQSYRWLVLVAIVVLLLALMVAYKHFYVDLGLAYFEDLYRRHLRVIKGRTIDPWQYRVLAAYILEAVVALARKLSVPAPEWYASVALRTAQLFLMLMASYFYWTKLSIHRYLALIGVSMLGFGIMFANYNSGLVFESYFDVLFYLLAAISLLGNRPALVIPIVALAAFNRETSALIPLMVVAGAEGFRFTRQSIIANRRLIAVCAVSLVVFVAIYAGLRNYYGPRPLIDDFDVGWGLVWRNLTNFRSYFYLGATLGILPLAVLGWTRWPQFLKNMFILMVPIWIVIHLFLAVLEEARLFLVPHVIVLIPAALRLVQDSILAEISVSNPRENIS